MALADFTHANSIERIFDKHEPEILFHTDTSKHLSFTERQPLGAVKTNFLAIRGLAEMADKIGRSTFGDALDYVDLLYCCLNKRPRRKKGTGYF